MVQRSRDLVVRMYENQSIETINPAVFDELLLAYDSVVPKKLVGLDEERYEIIPESVRKQTGSATLTKAQVAKLVDWKLSHGKFRPTLKSLVQQNTDQSVHDTTKDGFEAFSDSSDSAKTSLNILTKLKGIGPATASLLLSVYSPKTAPFFSDELFKWAFFQNDNGKGWDRTIKYNVKEYLELFENVDELRRRFSHEFDRDIAAVEIEKVAYVLGKRSKDPNAYPSSQIEVQSKKRKHPSDHSASEGPVLPKSTTESANVRPSKRVAPSKRNTSAQRAK